MGLLGKLFGQGRDEDTPELLSAIERVVAAVEPLLMQTRGYPEDYRKPVATALAYTRNLSSSVPGPVAINRESYASDAFVHALFPSADYVTDALCTSVALQDYHRKSAYTDDLYALMGMRRFEKTAMGMQLSGEVIQRDVVQKIIYFTSHTLENPADSEELARGQAALSFLDSLAGKVKKRIEARRQDRQLLLQEKDMLISRLRIADPVARPALEEELSRLIAAIQTATSALDLRSYLEDFEAVLLNPEQYLRLNPIPIVLDSMGIRQERDDDHHGEAVIFNELIGFDRRDWTVTMVHCQNLQNESFAAKLDKAYRRLAI